MPTDRATTRTDEQRARRDTDVALIIRAKAGDTAARNQLIEQYHNFIWKLVASTVGRERADEYFADGLDGFIRAINSFDPARGTMLLTYAGRAIVQYASRRRWKMATVVQRPAKDCIRQPKLQAKAEACRNYASLDFRYDSGQRVIELACEPDPVDAFHDREQLRRLHLAIASLDPRSREIVERRMNGQTLEQAGQAMRLTKERVRQIESEAHALIAEHMTGRLSA